MRRLALIFFLLSLSASVASACPACAGEVRKDEPAKRWPFYASSAAMVALPLGMTTGLFIWLRKRI